MIKKEILTRPRGTQDIFPPRSLVFNWIQKKISEVLDFFSYKLLIFPTFEYRRLFDVSLDKDIDVIREMYSFEDRKKRNLVLRPEGTLSVARAVIQNKLWNFSFPTKFFYWANMFRYERPQRGRNREFWQLGVELINSHGIFSDISIINLLNEILKNLKIKNFFFKINFLGNEKTKRNYQKEITKDIKKKEILFCEICQKRLLKDSLRILDCNICKTKVPPYSISWEKEDHKYFEEFTNHLKFLKIPFVNDFFLVRGLDYYTGIVFEVFIEKEQENAVAGGGRYDNVYKRISDVDLPSIGFSIGIDRLIDFFLTDKKKFFEKKKIVDVFLVCQNFSSEILKEFFLLQKKLKKTKITIDYLFFEKEFGKKIKKICEHYCPLFLVKFSSKHPQKVLMRTFLDNYNSEEEILKKDLIGIIKKIVKKQKNYI